MRDLTAKQKKMLNTWYNEQKANGKEFDYSWSVDTDEDFSGELYEAIDSINPCEIFYQNVNNYICNKNER